MNDRVHHRLPQGVQRYFIDVMAIDAPYFTADIQVLREKGDGLVELRQEVVPHVLPVVDMNPLRSLKGRKDGFSVGYDIADL